MNNLATFPPEVFSTILSHLATPYVFNLVKTGDHRMVRLIGPRGSLESIALHRTGPRFVGNSFIRFPALISQCSGLKSLSLDVDAHLRPKSEYRSIGGLEWKLFPRTLTSLRLRTTFCCDEDEFWCDFDEILPNLTILYLSSPRQITPEHVKMLPKRQLAILTLEGSFNPILPDHFTNLPRSLTILNMKEYSVDEFEEIGVQTMEGTAFPPNLTKVSMKVPWAGRIMAYLPRETIKQVIVRHCYLESTEIEAIPRSTLRLVVQSAKDCDDFTVPHFPPHLTSLEWINGYLSIGINGLKSLPQSLTHIHSTHWSPINGDRDEFLHSWPPRLLSLPNYATSPCLKSTLPPSLTSLIVREPPSSILTPTNSIQAHWEELPQNLTSLSLLRPFTYIFNNSYTQLPTLSLEDAKHIPSTLTELITDIIDTSCWPILKVLKIQTLQVTSASLNDISHLSTLRKFVYSGKDCTLQWFQDLHTTLPNLTELDLCPSNFSSKHLGLLPRLLRSLSISICDNFDATAVRLLPPHLESLCISSTSGKTELEIPDYFALPASLRYLQLPKLHHQDDLIILPRYLPRFVEMARFGSDNIWREQRDYYNSSLVLWDPVTEAISY